MGSEVLRVKEFDQADLPSPYASGAVLKHPLVWRRKEQNGILPPPRLRYNFALKPFLPVEEILSTPGPQ